MGKIVRKIKVSMQIEGIHSWPQCPYEDVSFLKLPHRHIFHINAKKIVEHNDREQEFILLKRKMQTFFGSSTVDFKYDSCEQIAEDLIKAFGLCECEVLEDGENGAILSVEEQV